MVSTEHFPAAWRASREALRRHLAEWRIVAQPTYRDLVVDLFSVVINPYMQRHRLPLWDVGTIQEAGPYFPDFRLFVIASATDPPRMLYTCLWAHGDPDDLPIDVCAALLENCRVPFED